MKKVKKSNIRIIILIILIIAIVYTVYEGVIKTKYPDVTEGDMAPKFVLSTINNEKVELRNVKKDAVIINFWATWCDYCKREMPAFENVYGKYKDKNIEIISINLQESNNNVDKFIKENNITFPVVIDTDGEIGKKYKITTVPTTYLLDSKGKVIKKNVGEMDEVMLDDWIKSIVH